MPSNVKSCTITITASLFGQYEFPRDMELVSPVLWLRCVPHCKFTRPLCLEVMHCALRENANFLCMARAVCTQKTLPYTFNVLNEGIFNQCYSYGTIELSRFSGVGVLQKWSKKRRYWFDIFYITGSSGYDIHFAVTWHDNAHVKVSNVTPVDLHFNSSLKL